MSTAAPPILLLLCACMFLGSYVAGMLPLLAVSSGRFGSDASRLKVFTVFGAGLLVGTALAVIIPEGVQAIYEGELGERQPRTAEHIAAGPPRQPEERSAAPLPPISAAAHAVSKRDDKPETAGGARQSPAIGRAGAADAPPQAAKVRRRRHADEADTGGQFLPQRPRGEGGSARAASVDWQIGVALVFGFVFMLIVDQCSRAGPPPPLALDSSPTISAGRQQSRATATLGLLVHSAADGIALGAASGGARGDLQLIVFLAIMLHKAPAAFGLSAFLLFEGVERHRIKRHLLAFSLAAPSTALLTAAAVAQGTSVTSSHTTGVLMLFSAGTFLYVATVHVLAEVTTGGGGGPQQQQVAVPLRADGSDQPLAAPPTYSHSHHHHHGGASSLRPAELAWLVAGALAPCLLSVGHSHGGGDSHHEHT